MNYVSTRDKNNKVSSAEAIAHGISKEGGLFVPESFPKFSGEDFENLKKLDYIGRAKYVLKSFLTDFTEEELDYCVNGAYTGSFDEDKPAPMAKLGENINMLELWHGPTCASKRPCAANAAVSFNRFGKKGCCGQKNRYIGCNLGRYGQGGS